MQINIIYCQFALLQSHLNDFHPPDTNAVITQH